MPVYYVVHDGRNPGIYLDRELAELQLFLYNRAEVRWFTNFHKALVWRQWGHLYDRGEGYFDDFESVGYLGAKNPSDDEKCWVVFEGRAPGVYFRLADYEYQVKGYKKAKGRTYPNFEAAWIAYNKYIGNLYTDEVDERSKLEDLYNNHLKSEESRKRKTIVVYADGCCLRNGRPGARAGLGLYYGPNDSRNTGKPLDGAVQTNQRAELAAVLQALVDNPTQPMTICTDSQYVINCVSVWCKKWESNGYRNAKGKPVENKDLVRSILEQIDKRRAANLATEFRHVSGHSGVEGNEEADRLAKEGAERVIVARTMMFFVRSS